ncbi:MAG: hypothetical protein CFE32_05625 [Alphaproteobacteria bacterium PA3]|nr:MAG: hypothetical protein CFE32_05625 [Alphaproteobacteria bacterium PA3]
MDPKDPAFDQPTKPIGPVCTAEAATLVHRTPKVDGGSGHGWFAAGGPSPLPVAIPNIAPIRRLVQAGVCFICAGGGGIPVMRGADGTMQGVEAVIDKDGTAALLALALDAEVLLMVTEVAAVLPVWGSPDWAAIGRIAPVSLDRLAYIGRLQEARASVEERAGTQDRFSQAKTPAGQDPQNMVRALA